MDLSYQTLKRETVAMPPPPLPSFARLSLASEAVPTAVLDSKRAAVAQDATGPAATLPHLPDHVWALIMEAVEMDDPCDEIANLCLTNDMLAGLCADGVLYAEASRRMGFYGLLPDWNAVLRHYRDAGRTGPPGGDARGYFLWACKERKALQNQLAQIDEGMESISIPPIVKTLLESGEREGPFMTYLLGMVLARDAEALEYVVPTDRADYGALARIAVKNYGMALGFVPEDREYFGALARIAVARDGRALRFVSEHRDGFGALARIAVKTYGPALQWVPTYRDDYYTLAKKAMAQDGHALQFVSEHRDDYYELAAIAVAQNGLALEWVPTYRADYHTLAAIAVAQNANALYHVPKNHPYYGTIAAVAVAQKGDALLYVPKRRDDYGEIAKIAVEKNGMALRFVPKGRDDYGEIAKIAVAQNGKALRFVPKKHANYHTLAILARVVARSL